MPKSPGPIARRGFTLKQQGYRTLVPNLREFLLVRQARNVTAGSLRFSSEKMESFVDFLVVQSISQMDQVSASHLRRFLVNLQEKEHTPGGQHACFRGIRDLFRWLKAS